MERKLRFLFATLLISISAYSQSVQDTNIRISMITGHFSYHIPGNDMAIRFGNSNSVGVDYIFKTTNGWLFGLDYSFIFGENINNEDSYFAGIRNSQGYVIDGDGYFAEAFLYERGFNLNLMVGKQFDLWNFNPNSGPFVQLGFGFMQHYVRIENTYKTAPQINDDYAKLYDRMSNGFSTSQFIGYRYLSNSRLLNFYAGFEFIQGYTQGRRSYNADDRSSDNPPRIDLLSGIRIGWIIPLYGKSRQDFFYY
jgi:hypothetical protein